jgi:23S rRNA (cytosine1962-C5)-methyltransferase
MVSSRQMNLPEAHLKVGREKSVMRRHPWIYSSSIASADEGISPGDTVDVIDSDGNRIARGAYSPDSRIRVRVWTWNPDEKIDTEFFMLRLQRAISFRSSLIELRTTNSHRVVYGEADGLPGLVVDLYGDLLVIQCTTCGAERWRKTLVDLLVELLNIRNVYERSDVDIRRLEGLRERTGLLRGTLPGKYQILQEGGLNCLVDVVDGQKTGFYLDQRDNRGWVRLYAEKRVTLDCFSYTGGFAISALQGGAKSVTAIDTSGENLKLAQQNCELNSLSASNVEWIEGDVFKELRSLRDRGSQFDLIVLDPPKFAPTSAHIQKASRGYKDINLFAFKLLRPGGLLFTFSCSGGVSRELFQKIVAGAAMDAKVNARILARLNQSADHPEVLSFPEGAYLKGLLLQIE